MGWLAGWDKRIKLDIDYTNKIGGSVTWFPVTVFLTSTQGQEVFVELATDAEYLKVAFTKADGTTELYGECELFDVSEEKGIFHISRDGWTINADTSIYLYYDKDHADNTTYIGAINTVAGANVWDGNFKFACHMVDDNGNVDDSTSNNNDGTKKDVNEPIEAAGKVGQGQHYDGTDDWIGFGDCIYSDTLTIEHIINIDSEKLHIISHKRNTAGTVNDAGAPAEWQSIVPADGRFVFYVWGALTNYLSATTGTLTPGTAAYCVGVAEGNGGNVITYLNGTPDGTASQDEVINNTANGIQFGSRTGNDNVRYFDGIMDETRISDTARSAAWIKGTYNSLWDTLLTYGGEEVRVNALFFGSNF